MMHRILPSLFALAAVALLTAGPLAAITPADLNAQLKAGQKITLIDLRSVDHYQRNHIPGAINIPHEIVAQKRLPPIGRVVAYCDGLGATYAPECVAALSAKPGIVAEMLEGGFAAWETFTQVTTAAENLKSQLSVPMITFEQLEKTGGNGVVLVDVRAANPQRAKFDLRPFQRTRVPQAGVTARPFDELKRIKGNNPTFRHAPSLLVVSDDDNTSAQKVAERIRASGYKRVVVLAGGEEIIKREGRAGLTRSGSAASIALDPAQKPVPVPAGIGAPAQSATRPNQ
jgi:rhodanese-related sulfurtransferase